MITSREFATTPGAYIFSDPSLAYVYIIRVCRAGAGYNPTTGTVSNREYKYNLAAGSIEFENPFDGDVTGTTDIVEKIFVKYKY